MVNRCREKAVNQKSHKSRCKVDGHRSMLLQWAGFTLVELLVVISIISLLMGILMPALSAARDAGRKTVCGLNLHQIAIAFTGWSLDNDDYIFTMSSSADGASSGDWFSDLLPYMGGGSDLWKRRMWICPADKDPFPISAGTSPHTEGVTSYALNGYYRAGVGLIPTAKLGPGGGYKVFDVRSPSSVMLMIETSYWDCVTDCTHPAAVAAGLSESSNHHHRNTSGFYHRASMNLLFVDGHTGNIKGRRCEPLGAALIPWPIRRDNTMFWPDLTLPSATEQPELWGPGYR